MDSEAKPTAVELASVLRSVYRPEQLEKFEQMWKERGAYFLKREKELQAENDSLQKKCDLMEKELADVVLNRHKVEYELFQCKGKCEELVEQVKRLTEDQKVSCDRQKRADERCAKLLEDLMAAENQKKDVLLQLKDKDRKLLVRNAKFKELEVRVLKLEYENNILESGGGGGPKFHKKQEAVAGNRTEIIEIDDCPDDETPTSSGKRKKGNPVWEYEADLLKALEADDQLCMNAVCELYRHQTSLWKTSNVSNSSSIMRGCSQLDVERVTKLANFLTNEYPKGEVKKTVRELQEKDQKVLNDCRRMAMRYSRELFEIYQKWDPLFHP